MNVYEVCYYMVRAFFFCHFHRFPPHFLWWLNKISRSFYRQLRKWPSTTCLCLLYLVSKIEGWKPGNKYTPNSPNSIPYPTVSIIIQRCKKGGSCYCCCCLVRTR
ncbi:unnamed protein product [Laminaria digitata]